MMVRKHDLPHDFAQYRDSIHDLKITNEKFARLYKEYQRVDKEIVRIEMEIEQTSDRFLEERKKLRLHLKDELLKMILESRQP
jgi:uncharacterized protein YdcH (DUF465 family)